MQVQHAYMIDEPSEHASGLHHWQEHAFVVCGSPGLDTAMAMTAIKTTTDQAHAESYIKSQSCLVQISLTLSTQINMLLKRP